MKAFLIEIIVIAIIMVMVATIVARCAAASTINPDKHSFKMFEDKINGIAEVYSTENGEG